PRWVSFPGGGSCVPPENDLELRSKRDCQFWWQLPGASRDVLPGSQRLSSSKGQSHREVATQRDSSGSDHRPRGLLCRRGGTAKTPSIPRLTAIGDRTKSS